MSITLISYLNVIVIYVVYNAHIVLYVQIINLIELTIIII